MTNTAGETPRSIAPPPLAVREGLRALLDAARAADPRADVRLEGRCVVELTMGLRPASFRARVPLDREQILSRLPTAIPGPSERGTVLLPTPDGPIDLVADRPARAVTPRPFRVDTLAWSAAQDRAFASDPAWADLDARRLGLGTTPLRNSSPLDVLEGARWISQLGFRAEPETTSRLAGLEGEITPAQRTRARLLLRTILLAEGCGDGLAFLQACGFRLFSKCRISREAPAWVSAVPTRLRVRLAALLLDADARNLLRTLHFGAQLSDEVFRVLSWHPIEAHLESDRIRTSALRRFAKKAPTDLVEDAIALRRAQIRVAERSGSDARPAEGRETETPAARLDELETSLTQIRQANARPAMRLALDGRAVMKQLDLPPGRDVGRALAHLENRVAQDPSQNTAEALRNALEAWALQDGDALAETETETETETERKDEA